MTQIDQIHEKLELAYKEGYIEGFTTSVILFSDFFEEMDSENKLSSKLVLGDIVEKVLKIQKDKDFSNMYTTEVPKSLSKEQLDFKDKYIKSLNDNFKSGYQEGTFVLARIYMSISNKVHLSKGAWKQEIRDQLKELKERIHKLK